MEFKVEYLTTEGKKNNMRLKKLTIQAFGPFKDKTVIDFEDKKIDIKSHKKNQKGQKK